MFCYINKRKSEIGLSENQMLLSVNLFLRHLH